MNAGSLFSGIGGFDLGLERAGMSVAWQCEQDEFCQRVLAKHWPGVPCYPDITTLASSDVDPVDVLCGGFPCQDLSAAGKRAGITGERSRLWFDYLRLVREIRPSYVIVENVPQLRKYLGIVVGGLAHAGYDAEWGCVSAAEAGAPHLRKRLWIVAYPECNELREQPRRCRGEDREDTAFSPVNGEAQLVADAQRSGSQGLRAVPREPQEPQSRDDGPSSRDVADATSRVRGSWPNTELSQSQGRAGLADKGWWATEPDVGRVAHGVPARVDRLRSLGNALIPQIAEWIGRGIMEYECLATAS